MVVAMAIIATTSLAVGRYNIGPDALMTSLGHAVDAISTIATGGQIANDDMIIWRIRMPRVIGGLLVGGALGIAGAAFQGMFRNPMVSPDLLGASAGAGFGAAVAMLAGAGVGIITGSAFAMGTVAVFLTYLISAAVGRGKANITVLVLSGVVISALFQACISVTKYVADPYSQLPGITFFLMGGLSDLTWSNVRTLIGPVVIGSIVLFCLRWRINLLSLDENEAKALGVETERMRVVVIVAATLVTAAGVAVSGIIGWVGLVIPHLMRMIVGQNYRHLIPASFLAGAIYLVLMDDLARALFAMELPIGILTSLVGAPVFIFLLLKYRGGWD